MRFAAAAAALLLSLSACGKKDAAPAPPPPAAPVAPAPPDDSACKLVTQADALALLGRAVGPGVVGAGSSGAAECAFTADGAPDSTVSVLLYKDGDAGMARTLKAATMGKDPVQLPGIGTRAYRSENGFAFGVLVKGKFLYVSATSGTPEAATGLATVLANRI